MSEKPALPTEMTARQVEPKESAHGAVNGRGASSKQKARILFNRELSWLDFNARVLEEALNTANPLLERMKFLAIFSNNLDEFFMIYVPGMRDRLNEETRRPLTDRELAARHRAIKTKLTPMLAAQFRCYGDLLEQLTPFGIRVIPYKELSSSRKQAMRAYFESEIFPVLTPLAVGPSHPFPYISNLSLSLACYVRDPISGQERFARVKVPTRPVLPRLVPLPGEKSQYVLLEEVVTAHIDRLFPGMEVRDCYAFRVTRNADLELREDAANDLIEMIEEELSRRRFGEIERLELVSDMLPSMRRTLIEQLGNISEDQIYSVDGPLTLSDLMPLTDTDIPELRFTPFVATVPTALRGAGDIFAAIRQGDILLHHPYQSFGTVVDFLRRAAEDPQVLTVKHTLYRTSGDSPILEALIDAADNGKQVACLVELKARFDEANNINWARQLEKSGVHVVYGVPTLKTHCKVTLVVRREDDEIRRYVHVGTGNYNPKTAAVYTDCGLLTCSPEFGADATDLFNYLTGFSKQAEYRKFLVAPVTLRRELQHLVEREAAAHTPESPGRIIAKMNSLVDPSLIRSLYAASQAGVKIDLIIRGMCCLRPGEPGLSENIRVMSIVGRFLEHSRLFFFRNGGNEELYFGSSDWMPRNLDRRVEVVVPLENPDLRRVLVEDVLQVMLEDNCQAWDLLPDGCYARRRPAPGQRRRNSQTLLIDHYSR